MGKDGREGETEGEGKRCRGRIGGEESRRKMSEEVRMER